MPGNSRPTPGAARAGRRRSGARAGLAADPDSRWAWLAELGTSPIRLTPENVAVSMSVRWLGGLIVRGRFADVRGAIHLPIDDDDTVAVTVEVYAESVRTGISLRDHHLRGPLFLDAAHHPIIMFRGGDVMRLPTHIAVPGSLTIRGITRTEELRCSMCGRAGTAAEAALGWSVSTPPRPVGSTGPPNRAATTALCPECARRSVRDIEGRLDP